MQVATHQFMTSRSATLTYRAATLNRICFILALRLVHANVSRSRCIGRSALCLSPRQIRPVALRSARSFFRRSRSGDFRGICSCGGVCSSVAPWGVWTPPCPCARCGVAAPRSVRDRISNSVRHHVAAVPSSRHATSLRGCRSCTAGCRHCSEFQQLAPTLRCCSAFTRRCRRATCFFVGLVCKRDSVAFATTDVLGLNASACGNGAGGPSVACTWALLRGTRLRSSCSLASPSFVSDMGSESSSCPTASTLSVGRFLSAIATTTTSGSTTLQPHATSSVANVPPFVASSFSAFVCSELSGACEMQARAASRCRVGCAEPELVECDLFIRM
jgi:hypothetical protein